MEISISTGLYYKKNHNEILDIIKAAGYENIELFLNQAFIDLPVEEIREAIKSRGLNVSSIHLPLTFIAYDRDESEKFWIEKGLEYLKVLGGNLLVTHFFYKKGDKESNNDDSHFENIKYYTSRTENTICTENLPNIELDTKLKVQHELLEFLASNNCRMTFDTTHAASHEECIIEQYKKYRPFVKNIHLSDYADGNEHKVIGTGNLPIGELLSLLKLEGYDGKITVEYDFENSERNVIDGDEEAIKLLSQSLQYIQNFIE